MKLRIRRLALVVAVGLACGYGLQVLFALAIGYTPRQALIPSEALRVRATLTPRDPWAVEIARQAHDFAEADCLVNAAIHYELSCDVWGCERIPILVETRTAGMRGDCRAIAVALGSVLKAKGLPFVVRSNYEHVWIEPKNSSQGGAVAARHVHTVEVAGSSPAPASRSAESENPERAVPSHADAASREVAGESDSAAISAVSMIAAGGTEASGGEGLSPLANPGRDAR